MERNVRIGTDLGVLHLPEDRVVKIGEAMVLPQEEVMIITTGSQGEPFSALSLVAGGRHRWVKLDQDDTVLISATPVPGNETAVSRVISDLTRSGARVFHGRNAYVHVSGHATAEELKTFLNVVRPTTLVPIHGEYRHLSAHADLAVEMGVPEVLVLEDGDAVILDGEETLVERGAVESRYVYVDGSGVGDIRESLLRERAQLGDDGVVVVSLMFDADSGQLAAHPGLTSHGFMDDAAELLDDVSSAIERAVAADPRRFERDPALAVRQVARKIIKAETGRRPVVLPVICSPGRDRRRRR